MTTIVLQENKMYTLKVKPGAKEDKIFQENGTIIVWTKAPAFENKANEAVITLFKKLLDCRVEILRGLTSKTKTIKVVKC